MDRLDPHNHVKLRAYKERLAEHIRIQHLILFGSRARGDPEPESDYDLIVVSEDFDGVPFLKRPLPCYEEWDYASLSNGADILCYTPAEYEQKLRGINVVATAAKEGVEI